MRRAPALLLCAVLALSACGGSDNTVAEQAQAGDRKGYVAGDGSIVQIAAGDRAEPVELSGETLTPGETWDSADHRGSVVVVNLWASWCGPCEAEAPELVAAAKAYAGKGVDFVGIDYREPSVETGRAHAREWGLTYPSIFDASGQSAIAMQGKLSTQPSTAVLDRQGRIAAVVLGPVTQSTLRGMVDDVLAEAGG